MHAYQSTLPDHSWIKLYVNIHVDWSGGPLSIGYRLRWRSDIWRTDRGVAEVRSPGIRPATDDDIRHNAPGLLETVDQLLRTKVRRKLLNQRQTFTLSKLCVKTAQSKICKVGSFRVFFSPCRFETL